MLVLSLHIARLLCLKCSNQMTCLFGCYNFPSNTPKRQSDQMWLLYSQILANLGAIFDVFAFLTIFEK